MTVTIRPRIVVSATALATLAALGGIGAVLSTETRQAAGSAVSRIDVTEVATTSTRPGSSGALNKLMGMLPNGYDSSNCQPVDSPPRDSLATVDCDRNPVPNGPTVARFSLYPDPDTLDAHFQSSANADVISPCPGGLESPGNWHYNSNPDQAAGQIACGTYKGRPDLAWSQYAEGLLGDIQGDDLESLYQFWSKNS